MRKLFVFAIQSQTAIVGCFSLAFRLDHHSPVLGTDTGHRRKYLSQHINPNMSLPQEIQEWVDTANALSAHLQLDANDVPSEIAEIAEISPQNRHVPALILRIAYNTTKQLIESAWYRIQAIKPYFLQHYKVY
jgi:hypothetical protein